MNRLSGVEELQQTIDGETREALAPIDAVEGLLQDFRIVRNAAQGPFDAPRSLRVR